MDARLSWSRWWLHLKIIYLPKTVTYMYLRNNQAVSWPGLEPATRKSEVQRPNHHTTDKWTTDLNQLSTSQFNYTWNDTSSTGNCRWWFPDCNQCFRKFLTILTFRKISNCKHFTMLMCRFQMTGCISVSVHVQSVDQWIIMIMCRAEVTRRYGLINYIVPVMLTQLTKQLMFIF